MQASSTLINILGNDGIKLLVKLFDAIFQAHSVFMIAQSVSSVTLTRPGSGVVTKDRDFLPGRDLDNLRPVHREK